MPSNVKRGTAADQAADARAEAAAADAPAAPPKHTSKEVITEWLRGNSSIRAQDDSDFARAADDLAHVLDEAGYAVAAK